MNETIFCIKKKNGSVYREERALRVTVLPAPRIGRQRVVLHSKDGGLLLWQSHANPSVKSPMVSVCSAKQRFGGSRNGIRDHAVPIEMPHNRASLLLP